MQSEEPSAALSADMEAAIALVRFDREHGASWLAREAAGALARCSDEISPCDAAQQLASLHTAARAFADARPSMAPLANTVARIWVAGESFDHTHDIHDTHARLRAMNRAAHELLASWRDAAGAILGHARPLLGSPLYTHSRSGTVEEILLRLANERSDYTPAPQIIVAESRPGGEGVAAARALAAGGWHVTLVPDTACGVFVSQAHAVVLGADSVRADGGIVNKVGSYPLALAAREAHVPVYVLCEALKIASPGFPLTLEEMDPHELLPEPVGNIAPRNVYFDHTPADLITGVITERGLLARAEIARIADEAGRAMSALASWHV